MAVRLRLKVFGRKKSRVYRLVAAHHTNPRDGKTLETLGVYDPKKDPVVFDIKEDRVKEWLGKGAQPTETVERLLGNKGLIAKVDRKSSNLGLSKQQRVEKAQKEEEERIKAKEEREAKKKQEAEEAAKKAEEAAQKEEAANEAG